MNSTHYRFPAQGQSYIEIPHEAFHSQGECAVVWGYSQGAPLNVSPGAVSPEAPECPLIRLTMSPLHLTAKLGRGLGIHIRLVFPAILALCEGHCVSPCPRRGHPFPHSGGLGLHGGFVCSGNLGSVLLGVEVGLVMNKQPRGTNDSP